MEASSDAPHLPLNSIVRSDCISGLQRLPEGMVDLAFADPPFNIGYDYDVYEDQRDSRDYLAWTRTWMQAVCRVLKPAGTLWVAIGDEYAAEIKTIAQDQLGLKCRSWVIWYYTFGVNCAQNFSRSHTHLFHFVRDPRNFTFNDHEIRVPSARQLVYADARANPSGRLPDNTWVLRPQDVTDGFRPDEDTWYFPRVAGTFKERAGFHGCQMPEQLLGRIIRTSSNPDDLVLDPFAGSGTTLAVAKKLGRRWLGFELSADYAQKATQRIKNVCVGEPLEGAPEPTVSAPPTEKLSSRVYLRAGVERALLEAYLQTSQGYSADRVVADPSLNERFISECGALGLPGAAVDLNKALLRLRKSGKMDSLRPARRTVLREEDMDRYLFASEIALSQLLEPNSPSIDDILCDPSKAARLDSIAGDFAPGFESLHYRWAALTIRKRARKYRRLSRAGGPENLDPDKFDFRRLDRLRVDELASQPGVYLAREARGQMLYAGGTYDLGDRLRGMLQTLEAWRKHASVPAEIGVRTVAEGVEARVRGLQASLIATYWPRLNLRELAEP